MEGEVVIKPEPIDRDFDYDSKIMQCKEWNSDVKIFKQGAPKDSMSSDCWHQSNGLTAYEDDVLSTSRNVITVNSAETVNTEDEISFIKQMVNEEQNSNHDPAIILPTDLEIYAKEISMERPLHKCRKHCDKSFKTLTERALHETHEHATPFAKCNLCNKSFGDFFALSQHMTKHRNGYRYVCACSRRCHSYEDLKNHWKTHEKSNCTDSIEVARANSDRNPMLRLEQHFVQKSNIDTKISLVAKAPSLLSPQTLSFAEELKAFTAKYQLKTVAKKRTSAFTCKPVLNGKKRKRMDFEIEPNYAIPKAVNVLDPPCQDIKIKDEPIDEEYATNILSADQIQIKNEPHDDAYDSVNNECQNEKATIFFNKKCTEKMFNSNIFQQVDQSTNHSWNNAIIANIASLTKIESNKTNDTAVPNLDKSSILADVIPQRKVLLSKANLLSMKNVKIFKLGPLGNLLQFPSSSTTKEVIENKQKHETNSKVPFFLEKMPMSSSAALVEKNENEDLDYLTSEGKSKIQAENTKHIFKKDKANAMLDEIDKNVAGDINTKRKLPRWLIRYIEEQPEKKKIIEDLQRQFQSANEEMQITDKIQSKPLETPMPVIKLESAEITSCLNTQTMSHSSQLTDLANETSSLNVWLPKPALPESFFLKVMDSSDKELIIASLQHQNYYYAWICPMCCKVYTQKHTFISHLIGTHKLSNNTLKTLTVEVRPFISSKEQYKEKKRAEDADPIPVKPKYQCDKCTRIYYTKQSLLDHDTTNCGRIPIFICEICTKSFASKSTLNCHMTIHTGELRYQCKYCEKRFRTSGQVRVHQRKHTGEKPFRCQICTLAFTHRETLISHLSRHMDIKRYICNGCNKRFSTISSLTTHRNVRPTTCGLLELDTQAVGPLIRVTNGQIRFEPQRVNNNRTRRKICQEILGEIQNIPKKEHLNDELVQTVQED